VEAINIVFDGPPHMTVGGFVEVETADGCSMRIGQWLERAGGQWALRIESVQIPSPDVSNRPDEAARGDPEP
jgi:hypothetical protein